MTKVLLKSFKITKIPLNLKNNQSKYDQKPLKIIKIPLKPKNDQNTVETLKLTKILCKPKK